MGHGAAMEEIGPPPPEPAAFIAQRCAVNVAALLWADLARHGGVFTVGPVPAHDELTPIGDDEARERVIELMDGFPELPVQVVAELTQAHFDHGQSAYRPGCDWAKARLPMDPKPDPGLVNDRFLAMWTPDFSKDGRYAIARFLIAMPPVDGNARDERYICLLEKHGRRWQVQRCIVPTAKE